MKVIAATDCTVELSYSIYLERLYTKDAVCYWHCQQYECAKASERVQETVIIGHVTQQYNRSIQ
jgi:hypothetical protein